MSSLSNLKVTARTSQARVVTVAFTIAVKAKVKKVKLSTNPVIIPIDLDFPPILELKTIGNMGNIHGDNTVTIPAKNANPTRSIILYFSIIRQYSPHSIL